MIRATRDILLHEGHKHNDGINLRWWFIIFLGYLAAVAALALLGMYYMHAIGGRLWPQVWLLALYVFYLSLCCTFFPAPTSWIVLLMASPIIDLPIATTGNIYLDAACKVIVVAVLGAFATAMANLNEYHIFTFLLRFRQVARVRETRFYEMISRWFTVAPFWLIMVVSFVPVPVDVVRWLAIMRRYRRDLYFLAYFLGRFLRYAMLASTAAFLQIGWWSILGIQLGLIMLIFLRFLPRLNGRRARHKDISQIKQDMPAEDALSLQEAIERSV